MELSDLLDIANVSNRAEVLERPFSALSVVDAMFVVSALAACRSDLAPQAVDRNTSWEDVAAWIAGLEATLWRSPVIGGRVRLRPVYPADVAALYGTAFEPGQAHRWRYRGRTVSFEAFEAELNTGVLCQFVAYSSHDGSSQGIATAYNADLANGHCYVAIQRAWTDGSVYLAMIEACALLITYVFQNFPMRHLYVELLTANDVFIGQSLELTGLGSRVATYPHRQFGPDGYEDLHVYQISRNKWRQLPDHLVGRIVPLSTPLG